ncbi:MAG TPA: hypothetical protein VFS04_00715 [Alphaproteobacteria bacterium]|nr:hypothetical protein [Alphaproteobacteria bacterium]
MTSDHETGRPAAASLSGAPSLSGPLTGPLKSYLGHHLPRAATSAAELDALRRRAWKQDGVLSLRDGDDRLSWPERELVRQLGERLYGARAITIIDQD